MPFLLLHPHALLLALIRQSVWLLLLAIVFMPLEQVFALRGRKLFSKTLASDIGFYFIYRSPRTSAPLLARSGFLPQ